MDDAIPAFTPVTLLTGFLGSGKTTLLKRLLETSALADTAVLINEFGEIGLDHHLLERIDETMVLLQSGCLCCTIRGELADAMRDLHARRETGNIPPFRRLVIESTGLADPFPVLSTMKSDQVLRHHFRPANVITTVDAVNGLAQLATYAESNRQVAVADRLVIMKSDLVAPAQVAALTARLRAINPDASLCDARDGTFDVESLLDESVDIPAVPAPSKGGFYCDDLLLLTRLDGTVHEARIQSFVMTVEARIDWTAFGIWLTMLLNRHGDRILRVKGILDLEGEDRPVAIHAIQHLVHPPVHMRAWPSAERRSYIVFIIDGLDEALIRRSFQAFNRLQHPLENLQKRKEA